VTDVHPTPTIGEPAPPIHAETATGELFDLGADPGRFVVVWFYVRANTPG